MKERLRKLALGGGALVGLGAVYTAVIFVVGRGLYCPFWKLTGLLCPGCGVTRMCLALLRLDLAVKTDDSEKSPGWKFADCEMRGIPLRVEIGPKDMEKNQAVLVRRDTHEKTFISLDELEAKVSEMLETIQKAMYEKAKAHRQREIFGR